MLTVFIDLNTEISPDCTIYHEHDKKPVWTSPWVANLKVTSPGQSHDARNALGRGASEADVLLHFLSSFCFDWRLSVNSASHQGWYVGCGLALDPLFSAVMTDTGQIQWCAPGVAPVRWVNLIFPRPQIPRAVPVC